MGRGISVGRGRTHIVRLLRRLWPRTLVGQILMAAALALGFAQLVNFTLLLRASDQQAMTQASAFAGGRLIFAADRAERLAARGDRPSARRRGRRVMPMLSEVPPQPDGVPQPDLALRVMEAAQANGTSFRAVRVERVDRDHVPRELRRRPGRRGSLRERMRDEAPRATEALIVSAQLPSGLWISTSAPLPVRGAPAIGWLILQTLILYLAVLVPLAFIALRVTRPLRALTRRANAFTASGTDDPLREEGPEDLRRLIAAMNAMEARVSALLGEKDVMLGAIGHDLKTPLAALRVRIESVEDDAERGRMAESIDEMVGILDDILMLARLGRSGEEMRRTDLAALAETVVEEFVDRGGAVTLSESAVPVATALRPVLVRRALRNLIGNALKYGGAARVTVLREGVDTLVRIEDGGPGIDPARIEAMFEPFARAEASRNRATGGSGLGLTIARAIARAHGGTVTLTNRVGGGLTAELRLPG